MIHEYVSWIDEYVYVSWIDEQVYVSWIIIVFVLFFKNSIILKNFLGFGKTFRILMQSGGLFSPDLLGKIQLFQNCPLDFHKILHSHSTPKRAPACAMASKSHDWLVRNLAKISSKMAKNQQFFDIFRFFF